MAQQACPLQRHSQRASICLEYGTAFREILNFGIDKNAAWNQNYFIKYTRGANIQIHFSNFHCWRNRPLTKPESVQTSSA